MKGRYPIEVYDNRVHYYLAVERNITVIQGNSGTGKTELIRMIEDHEDNGPSSGVTLVCRKTCAVISGAGWKQRLEVLSDTIVFIDEGQNFVKTAEFASAVKGSSNYFVICDRDSLPQLPYSIEEIYGFRQNVTSKYKNAKKVYNETYKLYSRDGQSVSESFFPERIITEDSNAGFEFYRHTAQVPCVSAGGKDKVLTLLQQDRSATVLAIVDGAVFGPEITRVMRYIADSRRHIVVYAPESFEYLLLKADILDHLGRVTVDTWEYVDSRLYMSWEQFFTAFLRESTSGTVYQYTKARLNPAYLTGGVCRKVLRQLPLRIQNIFKEQWQTGAGKKPSE